MPVKIKEPSVFSAIVFIRLLEKAIARIDRYPISKDNFIIQQDAFKRLGALETSDSQGDDELYTIFATLDCSRKERDTDMRFILEFCAIGLGTATILFTLAGLGILPQFFNDHPFVVLIIAMFVAGRLGSYAVMRKIERQGPESADALHKPGGLGQYWYEINGVMLTMALLVSTFFPIYVLFDSSEAITYWAIVQSVPVAIVAPLLFVAAFIVLWFKGRLWPKLFAAAVVFGIATFFIVNGVVTNAYVETPKPYTSIVAYLYLAAPVLAVFMAYTKLKMNRKKEDLS